METRVYAEKETMGQVRDEERTTGVRTLYQEVDRQFNLACLEWAPGQRRPSEGKFYYDAATGRPDTKTKIEKDFS